MDERNELIMLYDYYGQLLTDSQREYFEDYYFNNFSLGEIAEKLDISRNAVHKQLKTAIDKLKLYEKELQIISKKEEIYKELAKIDNEDVKNKIIDIIER